MVSKISGLDPATFEKILTDLCKALVEECRNQGPFKTSPAFESRARVVLSKLLAEHKVPVDLAPPVQAFPDIVLGKFGVEVKFTTNDTWRSIANSVFEGTRNQGVESIYILFGKMGGTPEVRWGKYEDCVIHVRTSHVPRFEVEMLAKESLFLKMGVSYADFSKLPLEDRMKHIRSYARGRLKEGERLWWLEDSPEQGHTLPLEVRLYMSLSQEEKRRCRAEAALLCPQVVKPSRAKNKYNDVTMYLVTYHGILCPQARDLFSAGSVALRGDATRGGNYILRALQDIEKEMRDAAKRLEDALFVEYWGESVLPAKRIKEWLRRADSFAQGWTPSKVLFKKN
jgi:hypothetical protein